MFLHHHNPQLPLRPLPHAWPVLRLRRPRRRHRLHSPNHDQIRRIPLLRRLPQRQHIRERGAPVSLDGEPARHGEQARGWIHDPSHDRPVRPATGHERVSGERETVLPQGHVDLVLVLLAGDGAERGA